MINQIATFLIFTSVFMMLLNARDMLTRRSGKLQRKKIEIINTTLEKVSQRPNRKELEQLWAPITASAPRHEKWTMDKIVLLLQASTPSQFAAYAKKARTSVDAINTLGEYIDEQVIRPADIVQYYPEMYLDILAEIVLVEPYIWHQSIIMRKGRYGFRVNQLRTILTELYPNYAHHDKQSIIFSSNEVIFHTLEPVSWGRSLLIKVRHLFWSPHITIRRKIDQNSYSELLQQQLSAILPPESISKRSTLW